MELNERPKGGMMAVPPIIAEIKKTEIRELSENLAISLIIPPLFVAFGVCRLISRKSTINKN